MVKVELELVGELKNHGIVLSSAERERKKKSAEAGGFVKIYPTGGFPEDGREKVEFYHPNMTFKLFKEKFHIETGDEILLFYEKGFGHKGVDSCMITGEFKFINENIVECMNKIIEDTDIINIEVFVPYEKYKKEMDTVRALWEEELDEADEKPAKMDYDRDRAAMSTAGAGRGGGKRKRKKSRPKRKKSKMKRR